MNWLAHVHLSSLNIDYRLGNLIADLVKNSTWPGMSRQLLAGIQGHRKIDAFTDRHQVVKRSKSRLQGRLSLLNGIAVDVFYDHMLTRHWSKFSDLPLRPFLNGFYEDILPASIDFPEAPKAFVKSVADNDRLARYAELSGVEKALERIDSRLSERVLKRGCVLEVMPSIEANYQFLETDFLEFYPELKQYAQGLHKLDT